MSNENILQPIFNLVWDTGEIFFRWLFDGWITSKKDLKVFYEGAGVKNKVCDYPEVLVENENGYIVKIPAGLSGSDLERTKEALSVYLGKDIDIKLTGDIAAITYAKELPTMIDYKLPLKHDELVIPIAQSRNGEVTINFKNETPHVLITGSTGSGKSITLRSLLSSIIYLYPRQIELTLIDFKIVELSIFKRLKQVNSYSTTVEEAKEVIADELEECKKRYSMFESIGVTNIYDYNKKVPATKRLKYRFIVIEEFVMLLSDKKKIAITMLKQLACLCRASGQFLIITGQRFDNTVIDLVLRANIGCRLCHKMEDEANSKLILDSSGAEKLRGNGHMIVKQGNIKTECQGYFIKDEQIKQILAPHIITSNIKPFNISKDKLQDEQNKNVPATNNKVRNVTNLDFLNNL